MIIYPYKEHTPDIAKSAYIAENAVITGDVKIGEETTIWFNTVIRGDVAPTIIGNKVSVQDNSVLHQSPNSPLVIEDEVTIGHAVILHSCKIKKGALIGMGSIVLDNAEIGEGSFIGAGSLVPQGKVIPPNSLAFGRPAKVVRQLNNEDRNDMERIVREYAEKGQYYKHAERMN